MKLKAGDVLVLQGNLTVMPETLGELHYLHLAERDLQIARRGSLLPILMLAAAMALVPFNVVTIGFFGAAVTPLVAKSLSEAPT